VADLVVAAEYVSDDVAVISLAGEVDVYTSVRARECLIDAVNSGHYFLVLDMRRMEFLDSTGLGVIVGALKRCRSHNGNVVAVAGRIRIFRIFDISGLLRVLPHFNDVRAAIEAVSSRDYNWTDPPGPHECRPPWGWFGLRIYTADFDESLRLRRSLLALLKEFAIESVFPFPDDTGDNIRESALALAAPVSRSDQIQAVCEIIERYVNTAPAPEGVEDSAIRGLVATLSSAHNATIQLSYTLIAYADGEIAAGILGDELKEFLRTHPFSDSKGILGALKSIHAR
jgi:anti-sigma B factor antagonist